MTPLKMAAVMAAAMIAIGSGVVQAKDATKPATPVVHSPESIQCSQEADAKGLHGKERKKFRATCKKNLEKQHQGEHKS